MWLTAHRLDQALTGRPVTEFDLRVPALALSNLSGTTVTQVLARGKHILMRFDDGHTLHSHLRMDGSWRIAPARGSAGRPATVRNRSRGAGRAARTGSFDIRAVIGNAEWLTTGHRVHDLAIAATSDEDRWVGHLGPDVLGPDWDAARAAANLAAEPDRPIVEALLDQGNLAGVGNMYAAEILFVSGIHPLRPAGEVTDLERVTGIAHRLLRANRDHPEQSSTGSTARGEEHWVYLRQGQPCRRCRTPVRATQIGVPPRQRTTFWCPRCQPGHDEPAAADRT